MRRSAGGALPPGLITSGSPPSPTESTLLQGLPPRSQPGVSALSAIGLVAGILAVLLFVLWGAVSEMRVGWFVR